MDNKTIEKLLNKAKHLHTHPKKEEMLGLNSAQHVIIDRDTYDSIEKLLYLLSHQLPETIES